MVHAVHGHIPHGVWITHHVLETIKRWSLSSTNCLSSRHAWRPHCIHIGNHGLLSCVLTFGRRGFLQRIFPGPSPFSFWRIRVSIQEEVLRAIREWPLHKILRRSPTSHTMRIGSHWELWYPSCPLLLVHLLLGRRLLHLNGINRRLCKWIM